MHYHYMIINHRIHQISDFALSTIPLSEEEKPVIYINSILKPEDIHKIKEQILQYKKMKFVIPHCKIVN